MRKLAAAAVSIALVIGLFGAAEAIADQPACGSIVAQDTTLTSDLDCTGASAPGGFALTVTAPGVTLDLDGHAIRLSDLRSGVSALLAGVTIENGLIAGAGDDGPGGLLPCALGVQGFGLTVRDVTIERCFWGMDLLNSDNTVVRNVVRDYATDLPYPLTGVGIRIRSGELPSIPERNLVARNLVSNPAGGPFAIDAEAGISIPFGDDNIVERNAVARTGIGIEVGGRDNVVTRNDVLNPERAGSTGIVVSGEGGPLVDRNTVSGFGGDGIALSSPGIVAHKNRASSNGGLGIRGVPGVVDAGGNLAFANGDPLQCLYVDCK